MEYELLNVQGNILHSFFKWARLYTCISNETRIAGRITQQSVTKLRTFNPLTVVVNCNNLTRLNVLGLVTVLLCNSSITLSLSQVREATMSLYSIRTQMKLKHLSLHRHSSRKERGLPFVKAILSV